LISNQITSNSHFFIRPPLRLAQIPAKPPFFAQNARYSQSRWSNFADLRCVFATPVPNRTVRLRPLFVAKLAGRVRSAAGKLSFKERDVSFCSVFGVL
jgi:hypothetical protein